MIVLGADTHKRSHTIAAVSATSGELVGEQTVQVGAKGFGRPAGLGARPGGRAGLGARGLPARLGVLGAVSDRAAASAFCASLAKLMAASRREARGRGKSDSIDALAVARAALREGLDAFPAAHLDGPELDLRLLVDHRERLIRQRVAINNTLQWHLHDLWPELELPGGSLFHGTLGTADRPPPRAGRADDARPHRPRRAAPHPRAHPDHRCARSKRSPTWSLRSPRSCSQSPASGP